MRHGPIRGYYERMSMSTNPNDGGNTSFGFRSVPEGERQGLVNQVFPAQGFGEKIDQLIARVTSLSAPVLKLAKRAVDRGLYVSVAEAMSGVEEIYLKDLMRTEDAHEGLSAFMEKRKPRWKDR